jgi:predicted aconitase
MRLTDEEKKYLEGEFGDANRIAMELLVEIGSAFDAEKLLPIQSAHIVAHFGSVHQAGIDFLENLAAGGGKCKVTTTVDPLSVDFGRCEQFKIPEWYREKQERLKNAVEQLGAIPSWSCTPYHSLNVPRYGQNIVWAESSAISYANSVIGARTNRTPFGMDISASITGKVPEFGLYIEKNRRGSILFDIQIDDFSELDYHTLGGVVGRLSGARIPVIKGMPLGTTNDQLKCFGAGAGSVGSVALYHALGITPEARCRDPFDGQEPEEVFTITREDLSEMENQLTTANSQLEIDMVTMGCPLLSLDELKSIFHKMLSRRVKKDMYFWIYLSPEVYNLGKSMGYVEPLEDAGIWFSTGTCATISPVKLWGFKHVMTNSAKCAFVVPSEHEVAMTYGNPDRCILVATEAA